MMIIIIIIIIIIIVIIIMIIIINYDWILTTKKYLSLPQLNLGSLMMSLLERKLQRE